jgi:phage anti-repressor protein
MELVVLESKKGTKVVSATNLHHALKLPNAQYGANVRRWLRDLYEFSDGGIRKPQAMRDYARRPRPGEPVEDYYITLELAKLIALRTTSKVKLKYARMLDAIAHNGQMSLFVPAA